MGASEAFQEKRLRKDILMFTRGLVVVCLCIIGWGLGLIAIAATVRNWNVHGIYYVLQWIFAFANIFFPIYGIVGAWKAWGSMLFVFGIYCVLQIAWNILYIIGLALIEQTLNIALSEPFAAINLLLHIIALGLTAVSWYMIFDYYKKQREDMNR